MSVTRLSFPYGESIQWFSPEQISELPDSPLSEWLLSSGSLTQKLRSHCTKFEVKILGEGTITPFNGEFPTQRQAWVREVLLCLDGVAWIFARTLIPANLLDKKETEFLTLGTRPLGELLFSSDNFTPGKIEIAHFTPCHRLAQLTESIKQPVTQELWGRRRYFSYDDEQLIVSETFLPAARKIIEQM
ncbi:chorismate lyase [Shewanella psychropiezotolerans]|uniref:Probable chorismate pyruvate-lyase n=1 Tax=Shewanella psychropiezotolerans TaxID=2593655 RepID=A0ABX5X8R7_9GAMM|nr:MULTISPECIES: chorismate lyase [Shewanella]MPY25709.1 chorismate lyase [Shewanella sp. YLB-07]QDO86323.1 chorismate lyase [Shewanella psychropiezotolerans]